MSQDCIFCKIARGELPAAKVFEDNEVLAFMDINPVMKGHTLVIPKAHHDPITQTPPKVLRKLITIVQRIARAQVTALQADGINVSQANGVCAGQIVPHIHFHVIPRYTSSEPHRNWVPIKYDTPQEMEEYADRIKQALT
ncbi:MAG: HIT family protein [bacterium]